VGKNKFTERTFFASCLDLSFFYPILPAWEECFLGEIVSMFCGDIRFKRNNFIKWKDIELSEFMRN
jgi:hypothetical protein